MNFFRYILQWIDDNPGKSAGALIGFIVALLIVVMGPVGTLLVVLFVTLGVLIGKFRDDRISLKDIFKGRRE